MLGSGSKTKAGISAPCPTWSRVRRAGETAKVRVDWAIVSGVSPVSPYLELIYDYRNGEWERHRRALVGALPCALRQVGPVQQPCAFKVRQQGRDTRETGGTVRPCHQGPRCQGGKVRVKEK